MPKQCFVREDLHVRIRLVATSVLVTKDILIRTTNVLILTNVRQKVIHVRAMNNVQTPLVATTVLVNQARD